MESSGIVEPTAESKLSQDSMVVYVDVAIFPGIVTLFFL